MTAGYFYLKEITSDNIRKERKIAKTTAGNNKEDS